MKINHLPVRRFSVVSALLGVLAVAAVFAVTASAAGAAAKPMAAKYAGHVSIVTRLSTNRHQLPSGIVASNSFVACQGTTPLIPTGPCPLQPPADTGSPFGATSLVPDARASHFAARSNPILGANFMGITDLSQRVYTHFHYTPPDQGLCVGPAAPYKAAGVPLSYNNIPTPAGQTVVTEMTNDGWAIFDTSGHTLFSDSNADLFSDANSSGDPECNYDAKTRTYFFTEIGAPNNVYYTTNLAVISPHGYGAYAVDTSDGAGYCFPDFPHQGYDTNAVYITINEFCGQGETYAGSSIFAISKAQLVHLTKSVTSTSWSLGSNYYSFRPATGGTTTEYLLASEQNAATQHMLDVAWVNGDKTLTTGGALPVLSVTSIRSERYSEPVAAQSTGDDTTCVFNFGAWCSVPEKTLDPVDMRLEQVQQSNGLLFTDLSTSMTVGKDPTVVDGAAWFVVDPVKLKVVKQSYVGAANTYILMPSFVQSAFDTTGKYNHYVMSFSMTGPKLNPSTGYVVSKNSGKTFSRIATTGAGTGPHVSFSTFQPGYMRRRWGDYSRIAIDPATGSVWSADEWIPGGPDGADQIDNWGTEVWQLTP